MANQQPELVLEMTILVRHLNTELLKTIRKITVILLM